MLANEFNIGGNPLVFPKGYRIEFLGNPLDFGVLGDQMMNQAGMVQEMLMIIRAVFTFANQWKVSGRCCSITVFIVGSQEIYAMFHGKSAFIDGSLIIILTLTPINIYLNTNQLQIILQRLLKE